MPELLTKTLVRTLVWGTVFWILGASTQTLATGWQKTSLGATNVRAVENTPWGLFVADYDLGVYKSKDLGNTWEQTGFKSKGITDLEYTDPKLYASTYYVINGQVGLFTSIDQGNTWTHIGPNFSASSTEASEGTIYLGSFSNGLWVSFDEGQNWVQKIGTGWYGPKIENIQAGNNVVLVVLAQDTYISKDSGKTWEKSADLEGKGIKYFSIRENIILAASGSEVYRSTNTGVNWEKVPTAPNGQFQNLLFYKGKYYLAAVDQNINRLTVFESNDLGNSWTDTNLNEEPYKKILDMSWAYSNPSFIYAGVVNGGLYKHEITKDLPLFQFLETPWNSQNTRDLTDKITAVFDHSYPLLGYQHEPESERNTTFNYVGIKAKPPELYYSSHNGTDYSLNYGTEILAPAPGYASYYYCNGCGNTIKINHLNNFQSTYMHLQKDDLVATPGSEPVWVNIGDVIGKVGMTGNTSGPHLHFEILKDKDENGEFLNDSPWGRVDPYSWQTGELEDPWPNYGGTISPYLWKNLPPHSSTFLANSQGSLSMDNTDITIENGTTPYGLTFFMNPYIKPVLSVVQSGLKYVEGTSTLISAFTQDERQITLFDRDIEIKMNLGEIDINNIFLESLKMYTYNTVSEKWEPLPTVLDLINKVIVGRTRHLSSFAVFGDKMDSNPPQTLLLQRGDTNNEWYSTFPTISFEINDPEGSQIRSTYYSLDDGNNWGVYSQPFVLEKNGVTNIIYRSEDVNGNLEETKNQLIYVDTTGNFRNGVKVTGSIFSVPAPN